MEFEISTSQTPTQYVVFPNNRQSIAGGFGTVTDNGYGISYLVKEDKGRLVSMERGSKFFHSVSFSIECKHSCPETDSRKMADAINQSLEDMKELYCHELKL